MIQLALVQHGCLAPQIEVFLLHGVGSRLTNCNVSSPRKVYFCWLVMRINPHRLTHMQQHFVWVITIGGSTTPHVSRVSCYTTAWCATWCRQGRCCSRLQSGGAPQMWRCCCRSSTARCYCCCWSAWGLQRCWRGQGTCRPPWTPGCPPPPGAMSLNKASSHWCVP